MNQEIVLDHLQRYVALKNVEDESHKMVDDNHIVKVCGVRLVIGMISDIVQGHVERS